MNQFTVFLPGVKTPGECSVLMNGHRQIPGLDHDIGGVMIYHSALVFRLAALAVKETK